MSKYKAYQVEPEYQESPLNLYYPEFPDDMSVFGNKDYHDRFSKEVAWILKSISYSWVEDDLDNCASLRQQTDFLNELFEPKKHFTDEQAQMIADAILNVDNDCEQDQYVKLFSAVTGRKYITTCIRGVCQGDWNYVYYPIDAWRFGIEDFAIEYFNTGTEWKVVVDDNDDDHYYTYCHYWKLEDIKQEIAYQLGVTTDEITLYEFVGYKRIPEYREF